LTVFRSVSGFKHLEQIELEQRTLRSFFERWMKNVLIRTAVGWLRCRYWIGGATVAYVHADADIWAPPVAGDVVDIQLYQSLITRLVSLPPPQRLVYNLYVIDGYPAREVAGLSCMRIKKMKCH
jgi:DNA-directed RNA polymerase specialized sigma24 family protein